MCDNEILDLDLQTKTTCKLQPHSLFLSSGHRVRTLHFAPHFFHFAGGTNLLAVVVGVLSVDNHRHLYVAEFWLASPILQVADS